MVRVPLLSSTSSLHFPLTLAPKRKNTKADAGEVFVALLEAIHASSGDETELRDPARECCVAHKVDLLVRARVLM